jgi:hypothetical protein
MGKFSSFMNMKNAPGKIGAMGVAGAALDGGMTYAMERSEDPNGSKAVDAVQAAGTAALWMFAEPLMWGITAGQVAVGAGKMAMGEAENNRRQRNSIEMKVREDMTGEKGGTLGGNFQDSQNAATMRQRQMGLLRQHRIATESILGSEARQLHR